MPTWKNLHKNPKVQYSESLQDGERSHIRRVMCPQLQGTEVPVLGTLPHLCISSSGYSCVPFITSFNKLVSIRKSFPEFLQFDHTRGGGYWNLWSVVCWSEAGDNLGLELVSKVGVCASCETNRLTCAVWHCLQSVRTELNCGTLSWYCRELVWGKLPVRQGGWLNEVHNSAGDLSHVSCFLEEHSLTK